ncbi:MAG: ABC transporter substrate-binding protein [Desulfotignum sp.]|nr:ABC transporter substrate-binding protein [Desulfotignum sp.]MCF8087930.1 ABC transporter substrate-binding protein [Desulfotignum sp.]MCF8136125.1 ABC transporter substrate-binding protein [Desulfotignum sp.]
MDVWKSCFHDFCVIVFFFIKKSVDKGEHMKGFQTLCGIILGLFLIGCIAAGCSGPEEVDHPGNEPESTAPVHGGIYRIPMPSNPATLDPARVKDQYGAAVVRQVFDGLVRFDSYLTILPALARTWQVEADGRVYRFTLRENARFHNGDLVTAADVVFSISRLLRLSPAPSVLPHLMMIVGAEAFRNQDQDRVEGLTVIDPHTVEIRLVSPHMPLLTALGMHEVAILPQKIVEDSTSEFARHPVGTGPFRFVTWDPDRSIDLERFDDYFGETALLKGIHFKIYAEGQDSSELSDFLAKNIDEMAVYGDVREKLGDQADVQWFHRPSLSLFFYGMNCDHPHLTHPEFRKALSAAIDRTAFVTQVYNGQFDIARTILPPGMPGYSPASPLPDNDPDLARQHLDQALATGLDQVPELELVSAFQTSRVAAEMEMIKAFWAELGVHVRVRYITDWTEFETYIRSDAVQLYRYAWFADMPDPDSILHPLFASDSPNNFMQYHDPVTDTLLRQARETIDPVARAEIYRDTEARITTTLPLIPLFYMSVDRVYQPDVRGIQVSALGAHAMPLNQVWVD